MLAGRAAYIGGCIGTSNTLAGMQFGIPVFGTAAHSWVQAFSSELDAFRQLQNLLGENTVYLIDTYDTIEGARNAVKLGRPMWGVRLDSGNLMELARQVRAILDDAGHTDARIMATSDLNEYKILEYVAAAAPIDAFGVGTDLATSADAPSLGAVYKLVEIEANGERRYTAKFSKDKQTLPGAKQIFRYEDHDLVGCNWECPTCPPGARPAEVLQRPVIIGGQPVDTLPTATQARERALASVAKLPVALRSLYAAQHPWPVEYSPELLALREKVTAFQPAEASS